MIAGLKPYPEYRDSGVPWLGKIPAGWNLTPGRALFIEKQVKNKGLVEKRVLSLSYGRIVVKPDEKLHGLVPESFETYQIVEPGDFIIRATDLQNDQTSLRIGFVRDRGIITSAYLCLKAQGLLVPEFGYFVLHAYDLMRILYGLGSGLRQNLSFDDFKYLPVVVPPVEEQEAALKFLKSLDLRIGRAIQANKKLIVLLNEQKRAIIHRAVTIGLNGDVQLKPAGVPTLDQIPEPWDVLPFVRCAVERADYRGATPEKVDSGVFLVTAKNVRQGWIDYDSSREFVRADQYSRIMRRGLPKIGDVLLTTEAPLGNVALVDREDIALAQRIIRFRLNPARLRSEFALYSLTSPYFQDQLQMRATGSTAHGIKASKLPQLLVVLPSVDEQERISSRLRELLAPLNNVIGRAQREIDLILEYRTKVTADVVTGQLDVRDAAQSVLAEAETPSEGIAADDEADELLKAVTDDE